MFILHEKYISISAFTSLRTSFLLSPGCSAKRVIKLSAALKEGGEKKTEHRRLLSSATSKLQNVDLSLHIKLLKQLPQAQMS